MIILTERFIGGILTGIYKITSPNESLTEWMLKTGKGISVFYRLQKEQKVKYFNNNIESRYFKKDFL